MGLARALVHLLASLSSMWLCACGEPPDSTPPQRVALPATPAFAYRSAGDSSEPKVDPFAFDPVSFSRKGRPRPGEWLDRFPETGQTFGAFVAHGALRPTPERSVIVIQALGSVPEEHRGTLERIRVATHAFFQLPVEFVSSRPLATRGVRQRTHAGRPLRQYFTQSVLSDLAAHRPSRALAYIGVTLEDLYPDPKWNFVFGEADPDRRIAVYSLRRFQSSFEGVPDTASSRRLALRRSIQLIAHETGHVFGLMHCTASECVMNGSNSMEESDRQPLHLCPDCLRKLANALKFDVVGRYRELLAFYAEEGIHDEAEWLGTRLSRLGGMDTASARTAPR